MAAIARDFDATIIKNIGDSVIYYFPKTIDSISNNMPAFKSVFECGLTMIAVNPAINAKLKQQEKRLPHLSYRISADYGRVEVAKSLTATTEDLFGPTVNICSKINSKARPNGMVIGNNLYKLARHKFDDYYRFTRIDGYSIDDNSKKYYPIYSIERKKRDMNNNKLKLYKNIL
jgi:class 3 adenylate cyclase